jgi:hypothetical protein
MIVTDWQARHGLTATEHQTAFNQLTSRGYRLVKITGYTLSGGPRFGSIWNKQGGSDWQARHWCAVCNTGRPKTALADEFDDLMSKVQQAI